VAHGCNPSYSGGRDQEDHGSKTAWANSSWDPILKKKLQNRSGEVAQGVGPDFKPQHHTHTHTHTHTQKYTYQNVNWSIDQAYHVVKGNW
jgi:hypothetical protein